MPIPAVLVRGMHMHANEWPASQNHTANRSDSMLIPHGPTCQQALPQSRSLIICTIRTSYCTYCMCNATATFQTKPESSAVNSAQIGQRYEQDVQTLHATAVHHPAQSVKLLHHSKSMLNICGQARPSAIQLQKNILSCCPCQPGTALCH